MSILLSAKNIAKNIIFEVLQLYWELHLRVWRRKPRIFNEAKMIVISPFYNYIGWAPISLLASGSSRCLCAVRRGLSYIIFLIKGRPFSYIRLSFFYKNEVNCYDKNDSLFAPLYGVCCAFIAIALSPFLQNSICLQTQTPYNITPLRPLPAIK